MADFNRVVIKDISLSFDQHAVRMAVHPFPFDGDGEDYFKMTSRGKFSIDIPDHQKRLANALWERIPGLRSMYFKNGEISIYHSGIFENEEIYKAALDIVTPFLEQNLALHMMDNPEEEN